MDEKEKYQEKKEEGGGHRKIRRLDKPFAARRVSWEQRRLFAETSQLALSVRFFGPAGGVVYIFAYRIVFHCVAGSREGKLLR